MPGGITYEGVSAQGTDRGGTVFNGVSFWVARKLPLRDHFINLIKNNGGVVVPIEKNADNLIVDVLKKDAPAGALSYKFIEDSVKHGYIQVKDSYYVGPDPDDPRPVGAGTAAKGTRTMFTAEEDAILAKWVLARGGVSSGNVIYQDLAKQNPRHPWQSWRSRYTKTLSLLGAEKLKAMAATVPDSPDVTAEESPAPRGAKPRKSKEAEENPRHQVVQGGTSTVNENVEAADDQPEAEGSVAQLQDGEASNRDHAKAPRAVEAHSLARSSEPGDTPKQTEGVSVDLASSRAASEASEVPSEIQTFYSDLLDYTESSGADINLRPVVDGTAIDLWDLCMVVEEQNVPIEDTNWSSATLKLGLDSSRRDIVVQIQKCWEDNLKRFLDAMAETEDAAQASIGGSDEMGDEPTVVAVGGPPSIHDEPAYTPPHSTSGQKRARDEPEPPSSTHSKRRRLSPNAEIPSTPPENLEPTSKRKQAASSSPSAGRPSKRRGNTGSAATRSPSPPPTRTRTRPLTALDDDSELPGLHDNSHRTATLETQQTIYDVTPSQQLESEFQMATSPARNETHAQADEDSSRAPTPRPQPQPAAKTPSREGQAKAKRRSLPSAFKSQQPSPATSEQQQQAKHQPQQQTVPISNNDQDTTDDDNTAAAAATPAPAAVCETIPDWVDHYQALGYPHATVIEGLKRTTMVPGGLAAHVMESLRAGNGVPSHHEGVWTDRDDGDLRLLQQAGWPEHDLTGEPPTELAERKAFKAARRRLPRLENKHGVDRMRLRVKFLEAQDKLTTGT